MFVCWGELLWDLFPSGPELGGAAANVAVNLKRLGVEPLLVSRVGNDALGEQAIATLKQFGLDTSHIQRDATAPTGTVQVEFTDGEPQYRISTQAAWDRLEVAPENLPPASATRAIIYGTLAQRTELVRSSLRRLLEQRPGSCWSVCDLNLRPPFITTSGLREAIAHADALKMNESELRAFGDLLHVADPLDWLFSQCTVRVVAITRQARGCSLFDRNTRVDHPGFPRIGNVGDAVGAGDAFCAALAYHLVKGSSLATIAEASNDHARRVASARGAFGYVAPDT